MSATASERALWVTATGSPSVLRTRVKQLRRGLPDHALLRAAQLQCEGNVTAAIALLSAVRSKSSDSDCLVIDETLGPLLISRAEYARVADLLELEPSIPRYRPGRMALASVLAAARSEKEPARSLRGRARELLAEETGPLLRASTLQRCGLSAYYTGDYAEAYDAALEAARILSTIRAHRASVGVFSLLYALSYSVKGDFRAAEEYARSWEAAAKRCGNAAYEHAAVVARYEMAAERADHVDTARLKEKLRVRPLPPQFRERFSQILADTLPNGWSGDFRAVKANVVVAQSWQTLTSIELAVTYAVRAIAEVACEERGEARKHARRAIAMTAYESRRKLSPYELRYLAQSRALVAATYLFVGDAVRGRRLLLSKFMDRRILRDVTHVMDGGDWKACDPSFAGIYRLVAEARGAVAGNETGRLGLTPAEFAVLRLLDDGLSAPEIARQTQRSAHTVRVHTRSIIAKLGVSGRNAALSYARRYGLLG